MVRKNISQLKRNIIFVVLPIQSKQLKIETTQIQDTFEPQYFTCLIAIMFCTLKKSNILNENFI